MRKLSLTAVILASMALSPAFAQQAKEKEWCTAAHMQKMSAQIAKVKDATKKKAATTHFKLSEDEMKKGNMKACVKHMAEAHKALGI